MNFEPGTSYTNQFPFHFQRRRPETRELDYGEAGPLTSDDAQETPITDATVSKSTSIWRLLDFSILSGSRSSWISQEARILTEKRWLPKGS